MPAENHERQSVLHRSWSTPAVMRMICSPEDDKRLPYVTEMTVAALEGRVHRCCVIAVGRQVRCPGKEVPAATPCGALLEKHRNTADIVDHRVTPRTLSYSHV